MTDLQDNSAAAQRLADAVGATLYQRDRASQALGIVLESIAPGQARLKMAVREDMLNGHNICHGGMIFALADTAFAFACNSHNHNTLALKCTIDFLAPAHAGDVLSATAEERSLSGRTGVYDISISNQHGKLIALLRGNAYRVKGEVTATSCLGERS